MFQDSTLCGFLQRDGSDCTPSACIQWTEADDEGQQVFSANVFSEDVHEHHEPAQGFQKRFRVCYLTPTFLKGYSERIQVVLELITDRGNTHRSLAGQLGWM